MSNINRRQLIAGGAAIGAAAGIGISPATAQAWPARPVTFVCPWGAGGGTDQTARIVASILERDLKQPFSVVNRTGGSGVVGHQAIAGAAPDGYTIGMVTVEITMMHHQGLTELNPTSYTPLALMNEDPPGVTVNSSSPYKTIKELADAIKAAPAGKFKAVSGISRWSAGCRRWAWRRIMSPGFRPTVLHRRCRISPRTVSTS